MPYLVPDTWLWGYRQGGLHGQCGSGQGRELLGNCRDHKMATCIIISNEKKAVWQKERLWAQSTGPFARVRGLGLPPVEEGLMVRPPRQPSPSVLPSLVPEQ